MKKPNCTNQEVGSKGHRGTIWIAQLFSLMRATQKTVVVQFLFTAFCARLGGIAEALPVRREGFHMYTYTAFYNSVFGSQVGKLR